MSTIAYVPPIYEDFKPEKETKETPESHLLLVYVPPAFSRENIGAKFEYDFGRVRVYGERQLENNKWSRFNIVYQVPANCDMNRLKGKFEGGIVTITMPKKVISPTEAPKEAPRPPPTEATEVTEEPKQNEAEEEEKGMPPKSEQEETTADEVKAQKDEEGISQDTKQTIEDTEKPPEKDHVVDDSKAEEESKEETKKESEAIDAEKEVYREFQKEPSKVERIKEVAASASQVVTSFAKRFNEEDKQKLIYVGAAVLVVAIGVYASYKYRSSLRM